MKNITNTLINKFREYLVNEEKAAATIEKYIHDVLVFMSWMAGAEVTKMAVLEYKKELTEKYAPASVNAALSSLNSFFVFNEWYDCKVKALKIQKQIFANKDKELTKAEYENKIIIDAPTQPQKSKQQPFILVAGPSATMALGMMASFGVTLANALNGGNISSTITGGVMVISMLLGSLMWPSLLRNYNKRQEIANEKYRVEKYKYYLSEKEAEIRKSYERNCRIWNENLLPSPDKLSQIVFERGINLWERTFTDEDFLQVRLGIGARLFETEIQHPNKGFTLHDDALIDEAINLANKYKMLENVPIGVSLINQRTVGIVGESEKIHNTLRCMILNTVALHSPEDVKICVICNELQVEQVDWIKDLPHCWDSAKTTRYFATNNMEVQRLLNDMDEKIQEREELIDKDAIRIPHS